jgi:hypothetical protein
MSVEGASVKLAESDAEILRCYPIMLQLRPHLKENEFVGRVRSQQTGGFHLAYASDPAARRMRSRVFVSSKT